MANNPNLYNAVIAGATGANQQRWLTSAVQADYTNFQSAVVALAGAVDDAIDPISGDANVAQSALMQSIVQGIFADRFVQSQQQASYESIVGPIVALWNELSSALEPVAGGSSEPLATLYWTDPRTDVAPADQTGFIGAPFEDLQEAFDAAFAASLGPLGIMPCIILEPGVNYSGMEETNGAEVNITAIGQVQSNYGGLVNGNLSGSNGTAWVLQNTFVIGQITTTATVRMRSGGQLNNPGIVCNSIVAEEGAVIEAVECNSCDIKQGCNITNLNAVADPIAPGLFVNDSLVGVITSDGGALFGTNSRFGTIDGVDNISCSFCEVSIILNAETVQLYNCTIVGGAAEITCSELVIDSVTYQRAVSDGVTINAGNITITDPPLSITANVVVPAVAADAVGYVNVDLTGTALEGLLNTNAPVIVNPQSDLVAAGAGGGYLNARVSALNTVRLCFQGALAGGAADFTITRIN